MGYFALSEVPSPFSELDEWLRRRLRMCQWKQLRTRVRELRALGLKEVEVWEAAGSRKAYRQAQGLMSLADRYQAVRQAW